MTENPSHPENPGDTTRRVPSEDATRMDPMAAHGSPAPGTPGPAPGAPGAAPPGGPAAAPSGGPAPATARGSAEAPPTPWAAGSPPPTGPRTPGSGRRDWSRDGRGGLLIAALIGFLIGALLCGVAGLAIGLLGHHGGFAGRGDDRRHIREWQGPGWQGGPMHRRGPNAPGYPQPSVVPSPTG